MTNEQFKNISCFYHLRKDQWLPLGYKRYNYGVRKGKVQIGNKVDDPKHGMSRAEEGPERGLCVLVEMIYVVWAAWEHLQPWMTLEH